MIRIFEIFAEQNAQQGLSFNSNFLETNVINIAFLGYGLGYVLRIFLGSILSARQTRVLASIQEAEERLQQANVRLNESQKQLTQTQFIIKQIQEEAKLTAQKIRESILEQGKLDIERLTVAGKVSIATAELQVRQQIQQQIITLAIQRVSFQLQSQVTSSLQVKLIDQNIIEIGADI